MAQSPVSPLPIAGQRVAIANRAEIAVRIAATCRRLGAVPVLLLGEPDCREILELFRRDNLEDIRRWSLVTGKDVPRWG